MIGLRGSTYHLALVPLGGKTGPHAPGSLQSRCSAYMYILHLNKKKPTFFLSLNPDLSTPLGLLWVPLPAWWPFALDSGALPLGHEAPHLPFGHLLTTMR